MKKAKATIDFEVWNLDCPNCGADHKFDRKEVESKFLYCSECSEAFEPEMTGQEAELLEALKGMIQWTNGTAMYHLEDPEMLPVGFKKWEQLLNKAEGGA